MDGEHSNNRGPAVSAPNLPNLAAGLLALLGNHTDQVDQLLQAATRGIER